jgi:NAD(P)-dependent dehydrogenase (short-subunit alcohol dehydrogenase family)
MDLDGARAVITGAGRGIGRLTALAFGAAGARVLLCSRTETELQSTAEEIAARTQAPRAMIEVIDVQDPTSAGRLALVAHEAWGGIDVLVNNAAALGPIGLFSDVGIEEWVKTTAGNIASVAIMCRTMLPLFDKGGSIINLSGGGVGGAAVQERVSAYTTAKAAVVHFTETLAHELAPRAIRVNAIAPGAVPTRFTQAIVKAGPDIAGPSSYESAVRASSEPGHMESFLQLALWLASDRSDWLTGRLLSARWDSIAELERLRVDIVGSSLFSLRRIDGSTFRPT